MHVVITSTIVSVIQLKLYILISSFLYILRVSFTIYEEAELTKEQNKDKMLKDKIIVLNHYSQFSKDDKEVIEELFVKLVTARDSMRLKPEYKMGLENYLE